MENIRRKWNYDVIKYVFLRVNMISQVERKRMTSATRTIGFEL